MHQTILLSPGCHVCPPLSAIAQALVSQGLGMRVQGCAISRLPWFGHLSAIAQAHDVQFLNLLKSFFHKPCWIHYAKLAVCISLFCSRDRQLCLPFPASHHMHLRVDVYLSCSSSAIMTLPLSRSQASSFCSICSID